MRRPLPTTSIILILFTIFFVLNYLATFVRFNAAGIISAFCALLIALILLTIYCYRNIGRVTMRIMDLLMQKDFTTEELRNRYKERWNAIVSLKNMQHAINIALNKQWVEVVEIANVKKLRLTHAGKQKVHRWRKKR